MMERPPGFVEHMLQDNPFSDQNLMPNAGSYGERGKVKPVIPL
jgi:hypothetical protein